MTTAASGNQAAPFFTGRRGRPRLEAASLVVVLCLISLPQLAGGYQPHRGLLVLVMLAVIVPLLWRRRAPMAVFVIATGAALLQGVYAEPLFGDLAVLVAFYGVAATQSRRRTLAAAAVMEFGVALAAARFGNGSIGGNGYALLVLLLTGLVVAAGVLGLNVKVRAAYVAEVEARAARAERERDQQGLLAAAAERTRIAREMHDIVAHNLSVMIALNDGASFTMETDPVQAAEAVREASTVGRTALREMQRALGVLRDRPVAEGEASRTPAPTITELDDLLAPIRRTGLEVSLTIEGAAGQLSPGLQLTIYRLVQESLTNTVKHAPSANRSSVAIRCTPHGVDVTILDNGTGSYPHTEAEGSGQGIIGMHERAAGHGGRVAAGPTEVGWLVQAYFPAETTPAEQPTLADILGAPR